MWQKYHLGPSPNDNNNLMPFIHPFRIEFRTHTQRAIHLLYRQRCCCTRAMDFFLSPIPQSNNYVNIEMFDARTRTPHSWRAMRAHLILPAGPPEQIVQFKHHMTSNVLCVCVCAFASYIGCPIKVLKSTSAGEHTARDENRENRFHFI